MSAAMSKNSTVLKLRAWREHRGITQAQLARRLSLRQAQISELETGAAKSIKFATLTAIAHALGCAPGDLFRAPED